jgi:hypothetical protein
MLEYVLTFAAVYAAAALPVALLCVKMHKSLFGRPPGIAAAALYFTPFFNLAGARKLFTGKTSPVRITAAALLYAALAARIFALNLVERFPELLLYAAVAMAAALVIMGALYIFDALGYAKFMGCSPFTSFFAAVLAPAAFYLLAVRSQDYFNSMKGAIDGTFDYES